MSAVETYEELEHTADWTIRVWGTTLEKLFGHAAAAMFELSGADLAADPTVAAQARCQGVDRESLLIAWLNELIYLSEINDALYTRFDVHIAQAVGEPEEPETTLRLEADVRGRPGRGHLAHIKAVTYWDLAVRRSEDGWEATVTFDT